MSVLASPGRIVVDGLWANPPSALLYKIYAEAKARFPVRGLVVASGHHGYLRRVSAEFHRRLRAAGIYVEGAADVRAVEAKVDDAP